MKLHTHTLNTRSKLGMNTYASRSTPCSSWKRRFIRKALLEEVRPSSRLKVTNKQAELNSEIYKSRAMGNIMFLRERLSKHNIHVPT